MIYDIVKPTAACGLILLLSACGGGGGGGDGTPPTTPAPTPTPTPSPSPTPTPTPAPTPTPTPGGGTLAQMQTNRDALLATYTAPTTYTALSAVPTSGQATYRGYMFGDLANTSDSITDRLIGDLTMNVTFTASSASISGSATNFVDDDDNGLSGSLTLSRGSLDRAGNPSSDATLLVSASGTLTDDLGRDLVIGTQLEGDFLGTGHAAVGGEALGRVTVNGADQDFDGGFIATR